MGRNAIPLSKKQVQTYISSGLGDGICAPDVDGILFSPETWEAWHLVGRH